MDKQIWLIASGLTAVFLIAVLVLVAHTKTREATEARAALAGVQAAVARAETQAEALREQLAGHQARIRELEQEKETVAQSR